MRVNPRFVAYCVAHRRDVESMRVADETDWPGGRMVGFILWMSARWSEWAKLRGYRRTASGTDTILGASEHADFDGWLLGWSLARAEGLSGPVSSRSA